jgi:hypothetical protein
MVLHYIPCSQKLTCISARLVPVPNILFDAEVGVLPARIIGAIWQSPRGGNEANRVLAQNRLHRLTALFKDIRVSSFSDTLWRLMQPRGAQNGIDKERGAALRGSSRAGRCSSQCHGGAQRQTAHTMPKVQWSYCSLRVLSMLWEPRWPCCRR